MSDDLARRVAEMRWYHTLELPGGLVTAGEYDLRPIAGRLPWPTSMAGMRCVDIGSRDGFYAFEMERRGAAEVISVDLADSRRIDFPGRRPDEALISSELEVGNAAFETARAALGSKVKRVHSSIYELSPDAVGRFDFAVVGTLLLHLRDPVGALRAARGVLDGQLLVNEVVLPGPLARRRKPMAELVMEGGPFWQIPNPPGLGRMVEAAGLAIRASGGPYLIPYGAGFARPTLAAALRGPLREIPRRLTLRRGAPHRWILAEPRQSRLP